MILVNLTLIAVVLITMAVIVTKVSTSTKSTNQILKENDLVEIPEYRGVDDRPNKLFENL